jgi:formylglycine-generating enzyme required for sulfatase activity
VLVYIDQLEELVTHDSGESEQVAEALAALADGTPGVRVLATARSDFLSRLAGLRALSERLPPSIFLLGPMSEVELREAIVGPAALKGGRFESDALVDTLVASATASGSLPLLQFTLAELWERRDRATGTITTAALASAGGVSGALAKHADAVLVAMSAEERGVARQLLLRLVTVDDTRARRSDEELAAVSSLAPQVLEALVRGRIVVASEAPDGTMYEIAHEALVRGWDTLARWMAEAEEERALRYRLETAAAEWQRLGQSRELLWSGRQLAELDARGLDALAPRDRAFLEASRRARTSRRWVRRGAAITVAAAIAGVWIGAQVSHRRAVRRAIAADLSQAAVTWQAARTAREARDHARAAALAAWDTQHADRGEQAWAEMTSHDADARQRLGETSEAIERALLRDPDRDDVRRQYADLLLDRALLAADDGRRDELHELESRLALYDAGGARLARLHAAGDVRITAPGPVRVTRYDGGEAQTIQPGAATSLAPGAWLAAFGDVKLPLFVERGAHVDARLDAPPAIPDGYVYMPPGDGAFGSSDAEAVRAWFNAVPLHIVHTHGYLIAAHETTYAEWIAYLDDLSPDERDRRRPHVAGTGFRGTLDLSHDASGRWQLAMQPTEVTLRASWGEPIRYPSRDRRAVQDWRRMPVSGISYDDAAAYAAWLQRTGRLRTARLCTEWEWERAARGTDDRTFPGGDVLHPDDANFDETYGKEPASFGPDEVGSHPASNSPFGVSDLSGNVWEWVTSSVANDQVVARGGSYYFSANTARIANRELPEASYRDPTVGLRICADYGPGIASR